MSFYVAEARYKISFQKRKPFLKEFASEYLGKKQEQNPEEAPVEPAQDEEAKAMETEADAAAEQPREETEAGEPAANGAIATPMDQVAQESAGQATAEAAAPEVPQELNRNAQICNGQSCMVVHIDAVKPQILCLEPTTTIWKTRHICSFLCLLLGWE